MERNGSDGHSSANCDVAQDVCTEGVDSLKDEVLAASDPTLTFHEKLSLSSSGKEAVLASQAVINLSSNDEMGTNGATNFIGSREENIVKVEHDGEGTSSHDESSLFSFKPGIQKAGPKVRFPFSGYRFALA